MSTRTWWLIQLSAEPLVRNDVDTTSVPSAATTESATPVTGAVVKIPLDPR